MKTTSGFNHHPRKFKHYQYVYPVLSRRAGGISIGINLNPQKNCNFDCTYCQVDRTEPLSAKENSIDVLKFTRELQELLHLYQSNQLQDYELFADAPPELLVLKDISLSGDGEPTLAKEFPEVCQILSQMQQEFFPNIQLQLITNATLLHTKKVRSGLDALTSHKGVIWAKLDAGSQERLEEVDRSRFTLEHILKNLALCVTHYPTCIQSLWLTHHSIMPDLQEVHLFAGHIQHLYQINPKNLKEVQLYTIARTTTEPWCGAVSAEFLQNIAQHIQNLCPVPCRVIAP
jgi:wyosine [tRNA(Phe)-imidazoG37] synthetase (radical SAM superfamily)